MRTITEDDEKARLLELKWQSGAITTKSYPGKKYKVANYLGSGCVRYPNAPTEVKRLAPATTYPEGDLRNHVPPVRFEKMNKDLGKYTEG